MGFYPTVQADYLTAFLAIHMHPSSSTCLGRRRDINQHDINVDFLLPKLPYHMRRRSHSAPIALQPKPILNTTGFSRIFFSSSTIKKFFSPLDEIALELPGHSEEQSPVFPLI
jgi:hypothetical protein